MTEKKIYAYHDADPGFDAVNHAPGCKRYQLGKWYVDAVGGKPTQAEFDAVVLGGYAVQRGNAYPPLADGLDAMVKGGKDWEDYRAACLAVKAKYPKG